MVGDDAVDPECRRPIHHRKGPDARIDADNERNTVTPSLLDDRFAHSIAVANAMWNVLVNVGANEREAHPQNHDGQRAIYIVISIDQDFFFPLDGLKDPPGG